MLTNKGSGTDNMEVSIGQDIGEFQQSIVIVAVAIHHQSYGSGTITFQKGKSISDNCRDSAAIDRHSYHHNILGHKFRQLSIKVISQIQLRHRFHAKTGADFFNAFSRSARGTEKYGI